MSKAADEYKSANHDGSPEKGFGDTVTEVINKDEGEEESDEYEEIDDEEENTQIAGDEGDEGEGKEGHQNTLTHLLIGNPNGATAKNEAEYEEDDEDDEYVEEQEDYVDHLNKKRSIDEVVDKEASQGSKKIKA